MGKYNFWHGEDFAALTIQKNEEKAGCVKILRTVIRVFVTGNFASGGSFVMTSCSRYDGF